MSGPPLYFDFFAQERMTITGRNKINSQTMDNPSLPASGIRIGVQSGALLIKLCGGCLPAGRASAAGAYRFNAARGLASPMQR